MKKAQRRSRIRRRQKQREKSNNAKIISFHLILCWLMVKHKFSGFIALVQSTCSVNHISRNRNTFQTNEPRQRKERKIKPQKPTFKKRDTYKDKQRHTEPYNQPIYKSKSQFAVVKFINLTSPHSPFRHFMDTIFKLWCTNRRMNERSNQRSITGIVVEWNFVSRNWLKMAKIFI